VFILPISLLAQDGQTIFEKKCKACHTIGGGDTKGPDLKLVAKEKPSKWIKSFVKSSKQMIKGGDKDAIAVYEKFNKSEMPDFNLDEQSMNDLMLYLTEKSGGAFEESGGKVIEGKEDLGRQYFEGKIPFANKGVSCISCHNAKNNLIIEGGSLAMDLSLSYSKIGGYAGIMGILESAPYPSMNSSYKNNPLSVEEAAHIIAFLKVASEKAQDKQEVKSSYLMISGLSGAVLILLLMAFMWKGRKKGSVNKRIIDRQKKFSI